MQTCLAHCASDKVNIQFNSAQNTNDQVHAIENTVHNC